VLEVLPLEEVDGSLLQHLLNEEVQAYRERFRWDFRVTADLVRKLTDARALGGMALVDHHRVVGYSYYVVEDQKVQIGDVYVLREAATPANERLLVSTTLESIRALDGIRRVEMQPMQLRHPYVHPRAETHPRLYLQVDLERFDWHHSLRLPVGYRLDPWSPRILDDAAQVLYQSYRGHTDAAINDQFRSPYRARTYLANLVEYPVCGVYFPAASYVVFEHRDAHYVGFVSSCVSALPDQRMTERVGHIAQIGVSPAHRSKGIGKALMLAALAGLADSGCQHATLTATADNAAALSLYRSLGFRQTATLNAYVWPNWPA
jgi:ribosomal protein S18 acetylase RimI-like enzyme